MTGGYDPKNYEQLKVTPDVKELFAHISQWVLLML